MKTLKILAVAVGLLFAVTAAVDSASAAANTSVISLAAPQGLANPPFISYTWKAGTNLTTRDFVSSVANGAQILLTNVSMYVYPDQPVSFTFRGAQQGGLGATNAPVIYFDLSHDGGRTWSFPTPASLIWSNAITTTNAPFQATYTLSYTQLLGAQLVRATKISNSVPSGAASVTIFPSNLTFSTRPHAFWGK